MKKYKWQVPKYRVIFFKKKHKKNILIIPVINEGRRLKKLLEKIKNSKIGKRTDIIIIDGGSTDNSVKKVELKKIISGLILKIDTGKLGSQLRCAYDFALKKNYKNIITIDGNNKDDPVYVKNFIQELDNGFDFVQASRFIKGGKSINTPLLRLIAIRLMHAPIVSFFSGFKWTDTTQGFRGYSSRLLNSEKIKIFRNDFIDYELLIYLSYISPKYFNCKEIPTVRRYPKKNIPTKITPFVGNLNILISLIKTCLGKYNCE